MSNDYAIEKREIELQDLRTFAYIHCRRDGGPVRELITGRSSIPVGKTVCIKADMRAVPWQSMRAEKPMVEMCEVASPVHSLMTQPHKLEMKVTGAHKPWTFYPDMSLKVDSAFANILEEGVPFSQAVADWRPPQGKAHTVTLVIEIKDDDDVRLDEPAYAIKLNMAGKVYRSIGWRFKTVIRTHDIDAPMMQKAIRGIMFDHDTSISPADINAVRTVLPAQSFPGTLHKVMHALGGNVLGRAKAAALHVRRIISIDLTHDLHPDTPVRLLDDGGVIFEREGAYPW
ncbi:hypothetical protein ACSHT0_16160 [Tepidicaulis sp. LMO-SS28]|uniref:hypothetical protein n=1 Tax=Tepidicaulis sp. LMO-SS28 TaxID=3447455 RepID=UPI003EE3413F